MDEKKKCSMPASEDEITPEKILEGVTGGSGETDDAVSPFDNIPRVTEYDYDDDVAGRV